MYIWNRDFHRGRGFQGIIAAVFIVVVVSYATTKLIYGAPVSTDEIFFKSAGLHWAEHGNWSAPEEKGVGKLSPGLDEVFFTYPPLYPFLFGCWVKVIGFGMRSCIGYDLVIHVALVLLTVAMLRVMLTDERAWLAWVAGIPLIFAGQGSRPDELAMVFGYAAIFFTLRASLTTRVRAIVTGVFLGLCCAASFPCCLCCSTIWASFRLFGTGTQSHKFEEIAVAAVVAIAVLAAAVLPVIISHPGAIAQNLMGSQNVMGREFWPSITTLVRYSPQLACSFFCFALASGAAALVSLASGHFGRWLQWWLAPTLFAVFMFTSNTFQGAYHWFYVPWWIIAASVLPLNKASWRVLDYASRLMLLPALFLLAIPGLRDLYSTATLSPEDRMDAQRGVLQRLIPKGAQVATSEYWWHLAQHANVRDLIDPKSPALSDVEYIAISGRGSGAIGKHRRLPPSLEAAIADGSFVTIHNGLSHARLTVFGFAISASTPGYGCVIYARRLARPRVVKTTLKPQVSSYHTPCGSAVGPRMIQVPYCELTRSRSVPLRSSA